MSGFLPPATLVIVAMMAIVRSNFRQPLLNSATFWKCAFDGLGMDLSCYSAVNEGLAEAKEFDKAGSAIAATLLTLLPAPLPSHHYRQQEFEIYTT